MHQQIKIIIQINLMLKPKLHQSVNIKNYMFDESMVNIILPGDLITNDAAFMHGHGTYHHNGGIYSSLLGSVQKTNKLIIVNPLKCKYSPQIGDIVVGRVVEIINKRWKVDINAPTHAFLHLNSTYFPEQRKKNEDDELNMRNTLTENDLLVAQIHSINNDKTVNLHTRNVKYGRLEEGTLVSVDHKLVKKQRHHLIQIDQVSLVFSNNGNIWLSNKRRNQSLETFNSNQGINEYSLEQIKQVNLLGAIIRVLNHEGLDISEQLLKDLKKYCDSHNITASEILYKSALQEYLSDYIHTSVPKKISQLSKSVFFE